jgi:hypothetical protein
MKRLLSFLILFVMVSCNRYPESNFNFTAKAREFLSFFKYNDTLLYQDLKGKVDTFIITTLDSSKHIPPLFESFSFGGAQKSIDICYRQYPNDVWGMTETNNHKKIYHEASIVDITSNYGSLIDEVWIKFKNISLVYEDTAKIGVFKTDTIILNGKVFTNYLDIGADDKRQKDSADVNNIYWDNKYGIIAYKYKNGDFWKRINLK